MKDPKPPVAVGDWVAVYNTMWRGNRPLPRPCQVVSVGARVKVRPLEKDDTLAERYYLLHFHDVLAVFPDRETGMIRCASALAIWEKGTADMKAIEAQRDDAVLHALRRAP